jgi:hypothetical protein
MERRAHKADSCQSAQAGTEETPDAQRCSGPQGPQSVPRKSPEARQGDREGQHSIRINDRYRICFEWLDGNAYNLDPS